MFPKLAIFLLLSTLTFADATPTLRWTDTASNCTLRTSADGHTYYTLTTSEFEITLAVDRQELAKIQHRAVPIVSLLLTFHYTGSAQVEFGDKPFTLEFVKNSHVVHNSVNPDDLVANIQTNMDNLTDEMNYRVRKHPDQQKKNEPELQERLKAYTDLTDFVSTRGLRGVTLSPSNSTVSGWVFFSTIDRWIGNLRPPQEFILRIPVNKLMIEFPFELPPKAGKIELRRRSAQ